MSVFVPVSVFAQGAGDICNIYIVGEVMCNLLGTVIYVVPVTLTSWILWAAGSFLNFILDYTVVDMRENIDAITGINIAWRTIRDLANISFIFILLYAAINTILEQEKDWQRVVRSIIIAAVLINFSLFFTKLLIDASNIVALTFYQQMVPNGDITVGLSNYYLQPLGLSSFWSPGSASEIIKGFDFGKMIVMSIGTSIFFLITAFTFFATAAMFLIRYVNFIFLLILSPIAVLGSVFSNGTLSSNINKWWSTLTGQLLFAPLFMIMTWAVITIINSPGFQTVGTTGTGATLGAFSGMFHAEMGAFGLIMNFLIITALAIGTLTTAKSVANQGGSAGQKVIGAALGFGVAGAGFAGRNTAGRLGSRLTRSTWLKDKADEEGAKGFAARMALKTSNIASKGSFDLRSSRVATKLNEVGEKSGMGGFKDFGFDMKGAGKGGIRKYQEERTKELEKKFEERAKLLGASSSKEKDTLKARREEQEQVLKAQLEREQEEAKIETAEETRQKSALSTEIKNLERQAIERERAASFATSESEKATFENEAKTYRDAIAEKEKTLATITETQEKRATEAGGNTRSQLEKIGVVDESKLEGKSKEEKEKYKKEIETNKKDIESGQDRVKREAERIASKSSMTFSTFSAKEARKKVLDKIKKGGEKKPEEILKEAIEKEAKAQTEKEKNESPDTSGSKKGGGSK